MQKNDISSSQKSESLLKNTCEGGGLLFGQCPKERMFFSGMASLIPLNTVRIKFGPSSPMVFALENCLMGVLQFN